MEANSNGFGDLGTAINEAVTLGAKVVSDSWGTGEFDGETGWDGNVDHPGVAITFSSGDGAYAGGVQYPSASPYVTSVGGTELTPASSSRGWTEAAWVTPGSPPTQGSGSGCSAYEPKPPWQRDAGCANRTTADVSAVAANVLSYDTYQASGWYYSFGTSVSAPVIAGVYGLAKNPASITIPASAAYGAPAADRHDITKGSTGTCTPPATQAYLCKAGKGYDGPTGLGTPKGIGAFKVPATTSPSISGVSFSGSPSDPSITVTGTNFGAYPPIGTPETCQSRGHRRRLRLIRAVAQRRHPGRLDGRTGRQLHRPDRDVVEQHAGGVRLRQRVRQLPAGPVRRPGRGRGPGRRPSAAR